MLGGGKKDVCNVVVSFIALEIKLDNNNKANKGKTNYLSLVFKRGDQQRNETEKFEHRSLGNSPKDNQISVADNAEKYKQIIRNAGQSNFDQFENEGSIHSSVQRSSQSEIFAT